MVALKNISIILLYIFILGQVQASEPKVKVDVQVEGELTWGQAVEGLRCRLRADKQAWKVDETPILKADVENLSNREFLIYQTEQLYELNVDGSWYNQREIGAISSFFPPGRRYNDIQFTLDGRWYKKNGDAQLKLSPGRHIVHVAFTAQTTNKNDREITRFVSNSVEIKILPPDSSSAENLTTEKLRWIDDETGQKLLDVDDIVRFDWDKQIFELIRPAAMDFMAELGSLGVQGRKFILKDGQVVIYKGTLVTLMSSIACPGPVIRDPILPDDIKPPLFKIDNGYPEPIAKSDPDPRFSERLKYALRQTGILGEVDLKNPPAPIKKDSHGWYGKKEGLRALIEVFPETFRLRRQLRMHIHLTGPKNLDENHVFDVNATLISKDGKSKFSTKKIFPYHHTGWKNIYVLEMNPWEDAGKSRRRVKPGPAKLSVEVSTRKILDESTKTYSEPIENVKTDAINVWVQPGRALLPETPNKVMIRFQKAIKDSDWPKALEYCSNKIKSKAQEYDSIGTFFNDVLPIDNIAALSEFQVSGTGSRNDEVIRYSCEIELKDPDYRWPLNWNLSVLKEDSIWVVEFPTKPLNIWLKHEVLKMKVGNDNLLIDSEKSRAGFDVRLIPLSQGFVVGKPMLFRLEMKNISDETLGYMHTSFMVNDPMIVKDLNGTIVPYIDTSYQTAIWPEFVEPQKTVVLAGSYDVRSQYHIAKPGKYSFQFRGIISMGISPSNIVEFEIKPGRLSPLEHIVQDLMPALPEGWKLTRRLEPFELSTKEQTDMLMVHLIGKKKGKGLGISILIRIFLDSDNTRIKLKNNVFELEFWGNSKWGPVYAKSLDAESLWPNYKEQIIKALDIQKLTKNPNVRDENEKKVIATVLANKIFSVDIEPGAEMLEKNKSKMTDEQFNQWFKQYRESELRRLVFVPLFQEYANSNGIEATEAEIKVFSLAMSQQMAKQNIQWRQERDKLAKELDNPDVDQNRKHEIESQIKMFDKILKRREEKKPNKTYEGPAKELVRVWKVNKSLFEKYGGRVIFQQGGPEPLDAYREFLKQQQTDGLFEIKDKLTSDLFWNYFINDDIHTFYSDVNEAARFMEKPWWLIEPVGNTQKPDVQVEFEGDKYNFMARGGKGRVEALDPNAANLIRRYLCALEQSHWKTAISMCSISVMDKAQQYPTPESFFNTVVPVKEILDKLRDPRIGYWLPPPKYFAYIFDVRISRPDMPRDVSWVWKTRRLEGRANWEIDFPAIPFETWLANENQVITQAIKETEQLIKEMAPRLKGVRLLLTAKREEFVVGEPIYFCLQIINQGDSILSYDCQQVTVNNSMTIDGPDGKEVKYTAGPFQTSGGPVLIKPGETKTLFDQFDITKQYDIEQPGQYRVQFNGNNLSIWIAKEDHPDLNDISKSFGYYPGIPPTFECYPGILPTNVVVITIHSDIKQETLDVGKDGVEGEKTASLKKLSIIAKKKSDVQVEALNTNGSSEEMVSGAGVIEVEDPVHDFGKVGFNNYYNCQFKFKNTGQGPLHISKIKSSCGCAVPELDKKTYAPGESGTVKVKYHSPRKEGPVTKYLYILSDDKKHPSTDLVIKAMVEAKVAVDPEKLELSLRAENAGLDSITLTSKDGRAFSIKKFLVSKNIITLDFDPALEATEFVLKPKVDLEKLKKTKKGTIIFYLTHPESDQLYVSFAAEAPFTVSQQFIYIRDAKPGKIITRDIWVTSKYAEKVNIESITSKNNFMEVIARQPEADRVKLRVRITPPAPSSGSTYFSDELRIKLKNGEDLTVRCRGWFAK